MYILFEIPDKLLIIIAIIIVLLITIGVIFYKVFSRKKIKPIKEDERYDIEEDDDYSPLTVEDFFDDNNELNEELTHEQIEAKEEIQRVFDKMSRDLENQKENDEIDDFERMQEEDAIISYQELMERASYLKNSADDYEREYEKKVETNIDDVLDAYERKVEKRNENNNHKFKNSDIVSPIYGIQSNKNMVKFEKKNTNSKKSGIISKAYDDFDEEKTQNLEFLKTLKNFRKNL